MRGLSKPAWSSAAAQRADAPVHHVRRRNDIDAGLGVAQRLPRQRRDGQVVRHVAAGVEQAVLAMAGVGIERDVGDDAERRKARLQRAHGARHQPLRIPCRGGVERLVLCADHRKQRDRRHAELHAALGVAQQQVDALARDAGQRRHGVFAPGAVLDEHRDRSDRRLTGDARASAGAKNRRGACGAVGVREIFRRNAWSTMFGAFNRCRSSAGAS